MVFLRGDALFVFQWEHVLLIMGAVLVLLIGTLISLKIATIIYGRTFID